MDLKKHTRRDFLRLAGLSAAAVAVAACAGEPEVVSFGTNEGLPSAACNPGSLVDGKGRIWAATAAGAAVLDPARDDTRSRRPHPLVVERSEVQGTPKRLGGLVRLSPKERDVAFEYTLLAFHGESLIRYRTHLEGWEEAPSDWAAAPRREFTNLPAGPYVFRVWGRDADGTVSGPVDVPFEVTQSPWRSPAALVLWAVLAALLGLAAIRVRERSLRRQAEELEALVRLRTIELSEARDAAERGQLPPPPGGYFRQFFVRYPESALMYAKMMHTHVLVNQLRGDRYRKRAAQNELWKGQSHHAYWFGGSAGLHANAQRKAVYRSLIEAEKIIRATEIFAPSIIGVDFDADNGTEYLYQGSELNAYLHARGGALFELDFLPASWNYLDTLVSRDASRSDAGRLPRLR